jgi:hypothetical protein
MAGRLRTSFRSGNLAEDLGLLLLKGVAAVADVPRTEDIGLDAVATLLRRDADGNCYAEDSFGVQLKAFSETTMEYGEHGLTWLLGQSQPFFIGRVSLADARISVYPTFYIHHATRALHANRAVVHFGSSTIPPMLADQTTSPWAGRGPDERDTVDVWLGEPLLEWTLAQLSDKDYLASAYRTLKRFLEIARRELHLLSLNQASCITWTTNDADSIRSSFMMGAGSFQDLQSVVQQIMPALQGLLIYSMGTADDRRHTVLGPLIGLVAALKQLGATIETEDLFFTMGIHFLTHSKSPQADNIR